MAGSVIDTIVVESKFLPAGFQAGLAGASREFEQFLQRTSGTQNTIVVNLKLTGADTAAAQVRAVSEAISPAAFEAFSRATSESLAQIATSLTSLDRVVQESAAAVGAFFTRFAEGASVAVGALLTEGADARTLLQGLSTLPAPQVEVGGAITSLDALILRLQQVREAQDLAARPVAITAATASLDIAPLESALAKATADLQAFREQAATALILPSPVLDTGPLQRTIIELRAALDDARGSTVAVDITPLQQALIQAETSLQTFRERAQSSLGALPSPTIDTTLAREALGQIVAQAEATERAIGALAASLPAPDIAATRAALAIVREDLAGVQAAIAQSVGGRLDLDLTPLQTALVTAERALNEFAARAAIPVTPIVDATPALAQVQRLIDAVSQVAGKLTTPTLDTAPLLASLTSATTELRSFADAAAISLKLPGFNAGEQIQQLTALRGAIANLSASFGQLDQSGALVTAAGGSTAAIDRLLTDLERLTSLHPALTIDSSQLTAAATALEAARVATTALNATLQQTGAASDLAARALGRTAAAATELASAAKTLGAPVVLDVKLTGAEQAKQQLASVGQGISPAAFETFSQATTQAFGHIAESLHSLNATLAPVTASMRAFFEGIGQDAQHSAAVVEQAAGRQKAAVQGQVQGVQAGAQAASASEVALAESTLRAAEAFRHAGVAEKDLNTTLERSSLLSVQAAESILLAARATQQLAATSGAATQAQAAAAVIAESIAPIPARMAEANAGTELFARGLRSLEAQAIATANAVDANTRLSRGFAVAGQQANVLSRDIRDVITGNEKMAAGIANASGHLAAGTNAFGVHSRAANTLRNSLVILAAQSVGTGSAIGQLAQSVILFSGGAIAATAAAGAVLTLAKAYEFLTTAQREARNQQDKLVQGLLQEAGSAVPAAIHAADALTAALEAQRRARQGLTAQSVLRTEGHIFGAIADPTSAFVGEFIRRDTQARLDAARAVKQAQEDVANTVKQSFDEEIQRLGEIIKARQADSALIREATGFVTILQQAEADTTATVQERIDAHRKLVSLQEALTAGAKAYQQFLAASGAEEARAIDARLQLVQAGIADASIRQQVAALLPILASRERDLTKAPEDRLKAYQQMNAALTALDAPLLRQLDLSRQTAQAELERLQRVQQTPINVGQAIPIRVDAGTEGLKALESETEASIARLDTLRLRLNQNTDAAKAFGAQADQFRAIKRQIEDALAAANPARLQALSTAAGELGARMAALREGGFAGLESGTNALTETSRRLITVYAGLIAEIERQGGVTQASAESLRALGQAAQSLGPTTAPFTAGLGLALERLAEAQQALDNFRREAGTGFPAVQLQLQVEVQAAQAAVGAFSAEAKKRLNDALFVKIDFQSARTQESVDRIVGDVGQRFQDAAAHANTFFGELVRRANDLRTPMQRLNDSIHETTRGLDSIVAASRHIGLIGDQAANAIGSVLDLGDAIGNVVEKASTGNILGLIGSGLNVIGSIGSALGFGKSDRERQHDEIVAANTAAIERNTALRNQAFVGLGGQTNLATIISQAFGERHALAEQGLPVGNFKQQLLDLGASLGDLKRAAQEHGIDILNKKGEIVGDALDQLRKEILASIAAQLKFTESFQDQLQRLDLRSRLAGDAQDPSASFQRELQAFLNAIGDAPSAIADQLRGLDLGNSDEVRKALLNLFDAFDHEQLKGTDFGKLTKDDFLRFLSDGAGFLDSFNQALQDATKASLNIPQGFKRAALTFQNADLGPPPAPSNAAPPAGVRSVDTQRRPGDGASLPIPQSAMTQTITVAAGAIVVNAAPGQSAEEVAGAVLSQFRRIAMAQSGDTINFQFT